MKNDEYAGPARLACQLTDIVSSNLDYPDIRREILSLLESYNSLEGDITSSISDGNGTDGNGTGDGGIGACKDYEVFFRPVIALLDRLQKEKETEEQHIQIQMVKSVMNTLSYTELEVVIRIFEALEEVDGILVAGKIADGLGVTRSVVVSALRKLESARIVETRSLGVKGTYIKVLNPLWNKEMEKLRG